MVLQKRLDYGFSGFQVPFVPRSCRSARKRKVFKRKVEGSEMCAFELLATIAGNLLEEKGVPPSPSKVAAGNVQPPLLKDIVKQEQQDEEQPVKAEPCDPGSCDESVFVSRHGLKGKLNVSLKEFEHSENNVGLELNSIVTHSDCSQKTTGHDSVIVENSNDFSKISSKVDGGSPCCGDSYKSNEVMGNDRLLEPDPRKIGNVINGTVPDTCSVEYPMELDIKPPGLVSSDSSVEVPMRSEHIPHSSFLPFRDDVKVGSKDDDEKSSGCTQPSTGNVKTVRPPPRIGDRRIRKLLASKYWKVSQKLNDGELSNNDSRPVFRNRKAYYACQRSQRNSLFKRRKLFEHCSVSTFEGGSRGDGFSNSPKKCNGISSTGSASGESSSAAGQSSFHQRESHVKLCIKSFRVPELFIEIPETATVGSLKRTVMEAVNAILGGGLRVGVLLQGKKIRDDNKTLLQTGISNDDKQNALGFTLEPNPSPAPAPAPIPQPLGHKNPQCLLPCNNPQALTRYTPPTPVIGSAHSDASLHPTLTNARNFVESDRNLVPSPTDLSADKITPGSRALITIPTIVEPLTAVPMNSKCRRSELAQRRIRRPFSVTEVEALVQAVEKLGTGRWRDVKLRAFDNAKHRTYVDLKDKWKTLVHTARISPQQRRGEPVPQTLLDRVLAAHAYWSQQQAKQQVKQQTEACLLPLL